MKRDTVAWVAAAMPIAILGLMMAIPSWRALLLDAPAREIPVPTTVAVVTPAPPTPRPAAREKPTTRATTAPVASTTPIRPPSPMVTPAESSPHDDAFKRVRAAELSQFLSTSYRSFLPTAVGPMEARVDSGTMEIESTIDLERFKREFSSELPPGADLLLRGSSRVKIKGRLLGSSEGIARFRLEDARIGRLPVPLTLLGALIGGELDARGFRVEDPLIRPIYLPEGYDRVDLDDGGLVLHPPHERR